jgi:hypothetical protein
LHEVVPASIPATGCLIDNKETRHVRFNRKSIFSSVMPTISTDLDGPKTVALFCSVGLRVSLVMASYGLDFGIF